MALWFKLSLLHPSSHHLVQSLPWRFQDLPGQPNPHILLGTFPTRIGAKSIGATYWATWTVWLETESREDARPSVQPEADIRVVVRLAIGSVSVWVIATGRRKETKSCAKVIEDESVHGRNFGLHIGLELFKAQLERRFNLGQFLLRRHGESGFFC